MFGSQVLDTGIGLAMLFAFMSLIATSLNEAIETILKVRAKQLEQGIRNILDDPDGTKGLVEKFFNSPVINILYDGVYDATKLVTDDRRSKAAIDETGAGDQKRVEVKTEVKPEVEGKGARVLKFSGTLPSYIPKSNFAMAVIGMAVKDGPATAENIRKSLAADGVSPLKGTKLGALILQALDIADNDLTAAQSHLETWYDASMERVTGWYKRHTQKILFVIGIAAAIIMNVDAIQVGRSLMLDTAMRQAAVASASKLIGNTEADIKASQTAIQEIGLPIGWTKVPQFVQVPPMKCPEKGMCDNLWPSLFAGASMALGWLITALAIMLGAPFWFDLLSKLMQLRSAVKADETNKKKDKPASVDNADGNAALPQGKKT